MELISYRLGEKAGAIDEVVARGSNTGQAQGRGRDVSGAKIHQGLGSANRFEAHGWKLTPGQRFQFGDLRIEAEDTTVIVEAESGGGVTNLAKYWPHLATGRPPKRLVLAHLYLVGGTGGYISHRRL